MGPLHCLGWGLPDTTLSVGSGFDLDGLEVGSNFHDEPDITDAGDDVGSGSESEGHFIDSDFDNHFHDLDDFDIDDFAPVEESSSESEGEEMEEPENVINRPSL